MSDPTGFRAADATTPMTVTPEDVPEIAGSGMPGMGVPVADVPSEGDVATPGPWRRTARRFRKDKIAMVALGFLVVNLIAWKVLRPSRFSEEKLTTYECGENPTGSAWVQFNIRFYVVALIFIIFDVEVALLYPWAVIFRQMGLLAFVEAFVFIVILMAGLAYLWKEGDLDWVRTMQEHPAPKGDR